MRFRFKEEQVLVNSTNFEEVNRFMQYCVYRLMYACSACSTYFCGTILIRHIISATGNGKPDVKKSVSPVIEGGNIVHPLMSIISDDVFVYCEKEAISNFRIICNAKESLDNKNNWKEIVVLKEFKYKIKKDNASIAMLSFVISQEEDVKTCTIVIRL